MSKASYSFTTLARRAILARPPAVITGATAAAALPTVDFASTDDGQWTDGERFTISA